MRAIGCDFRAEEHAGQRTVARHERGDIHLHRVASRLPHQRDAAAIAEAGDGGLQRRADRIDHDIHATAGDLHHRLHDIFGRVVDAVIEAERLEFLQAIIARSCGEHARTGALGELDRRNADAAGTRLNKNRLAFLETAEFEQAIVRRAERHRHDRALFHIHARR